MHSFLLSGGSAKWLGYGIATTLNHIRAPMFDPLEGTPVKLLARRLGLEVVLDRKLGIVVIQPGGGEAVFSGSLVKAQDYLWSQAKKLTTGQNLSEAASPVKNSANETELPTKLGQFTKVIIPCPQCGRRFEVSEKAIIRDINRAVPLACGHTVVLESRKLHNPIKSSILTSVPVFARLWSKTARGRKYQQIERDLAVAREVLSKAEIEEQRRKEEHRRQRLAERAHRRDYWLRMSPRTFEERVGELFAAHGYNVRVTRISGDEGVDAYIRKDGRKAIVQCKHYTKGKVLRPAIQQLYGTLHDKKVDEAFFVATSEFSEQSIEFAKGKPIHLIDLDMLIEMAQGGFSDEFIRSGPRGSLVRARKRFRHGWSR